MVKKLITLIVEDDGPSEELLTFLVKDFSIKILNASTGKEAIEQSKNNLDIDLILMDIKMPEMNGYDAIKEIRKFNESVIIIAQTAQGLYGDRERAMNAGSNDYILKPYDKKSFNIIISKYFNIY